MAEGQGASAGAAASAATGAPAGGEGQAQAAEAAAGQAQSTQESSEQAAPEGDVQQNVEAATEPVQTEEPAEEGEKKPPHKYHDKLTKYFPDRKFESDEDYDTAIDEYVSDHEVYRERGDKANKDLNDVLDANPKLTAALKDVIQNAVPFNVAMAKHYGPEDFTLEEGDDHYSDFDANRKAREGDLAKQRESKEAFQKNVEASRQAAQEFAEEEGLDKEQAAEIMNKFDAIMAEMFTGKVTKETLQAVKRAVQFDEAVKDAAEVGEKKAKNEKIVATMTKDAKPTGDGIPAPKKTGEPKEIVKKPSLIDTIVDGAKERDVYRMP